MKKKQYFCSRFLIEDTYVSRKIGLKNRFWRSDVHSYIGITPDFGSEKRGSTPRWTTRLKIDN